MITSGVMRRVDEHHLGARPKRRAELVLRHAPVAVVELDELDHAAGAAAHARVAVVLRVEDDHLASNNNKVCISGPGSASGSKSRLLELYI